MVGVVFKGRVACGVEVHAVVKRASVPLGADLNLQPVDEARSAGGVNVVAVVADRNVFPGRRTRVVLLFGGRFEIVEGAVAVVAIVVGVGESLDVYPRAGRTRFAPVGDSGQLPNIGARAVIA